MPDQPLGGDGEPAIIALPGEAKAGQAAQAGAIAQCRGATNLTCQGEPVQR